MSESSVRPRSLLTFVATETGMLSYKLLLRYLMLCVSGGHHDEVFDIYDIMRGSFPSLDTGASSLFIKSFCQTARWREAIGILQELNKVAVLLTITAIAHFPPVITVRFFSPSQVFSPSVHNYRDVIVAALRHGDAATAWALYDELVEKGLTLSEDTWDALFKGARNVAGRGSAECQTEQREKLLGILHYMMNNQVYPQHVLAESIRSWFER